MPVEDPGGGGSGSGGSGSGDVLTFENWVTIPCPGFCPIWPCKFLVLEIPTATRYNCGTDLFDFPFFGVPLLVRVDAVPAWVGDGNACKGRFWSGSYTTPEPDPGSGTEGTATVQFFVCCDTENTDHVRLWLDLVDNRRPIGDPAPSRHACIKNACMKNFTCQCIDYPVVDKPGYNHGFSLLPNTDLGLYQDCDCQIFVTGGTQEFNVKCLCAGNCDCYGVETSLAVKFECFDFDANELVLVAFGTIEWVEGPGTNPFGITIPHWEGTMVGTAGPLGGSGCIFDVAMVCSTGESFMEYFFAARGAPDCPEQPACPPIPPVTLAPSSGCNPFYLQVVFGPFLPGAARFTIGSPPP